MTAEEVLRQCGLSDPGPELLSFLRRQRWFSGRDREVRSIEILDAGNDGGDPAVVPVLVEVVYVDEGRERYSVPLSVRAADRELTTDTGQVAIGTREGAPVQILDALVDPEAGLRFWDLIGREAEITTAAGRLRGQAEAPPAGGDGAAGIHPLGREQSNSSLVREERELLKFIRKLERDSSPELEMLQALGQAGFPGVAAPMGRIEYQAGGEEPTLLAILQPYLHNATDGFQMAMTSLRDLYGLAEGSGQVEAIQIRREIDDQGSDFTPESSRLGTLVGEMHLALASDRMPAEMRAQPADRDAMTAWGTEMKTDLDLLFAANAALLEEVDRESLARALGRLSTMDRGGLAIRYHGDLHLGQMVRTDRGWTILDFEGEPSRTVESRRRRSSPLRDVAGMLRSFNYAAAVALMERASPADPDWNHLLTYGDAWADVNREAFWAAYVAVAGGGELLPDGDQVADALKAFEIQKAVYEVGYELGHRPDLAWIAVRALRLMA